MTLIDLLKNSVQIFLKTRLIWLFASIFAVYMAVTALMPVTSGANPNESLRRLPLLCGVECLLLLLLLPMLFSSYGIVYTAARAWNHQPVTLRDTWERFKQRLLSLFLLTLAFMGVMIVLVVVVFIVVFAAVMANPSNPNAMTSFISIGMLIIALPLSILVGWGYISLMLDPQGGFDALTRGMKRFFQKVGVILLSFLLYFLCFTALQLLVGLAFHAVFSSGPVQYPQFSGWYGQYLAIELSPAVRVLNIIMLPLIGPIYFIMLALIYENAGGPQTTPPISAIEPA